MSPLETADTVRRMDNEIVSELSRQLEGYMVTLATAHPVPGYDIEDLLQEMRIKMWERVSQGKYDPSRTRPITYFSWVFRTTLYNLYQHQHRACRIDACNFSDSMDEITDRLEQETYHLGHTPQMVFCDLCARLVDPHSRYKVYTRRVTDPTLACELCVKERASELAGQYT
jgi:DNA-directed RNA polymerase specialized sigma24 family protein